MRRLNKNHKRASRTSKGPRHGLCLLATFVATMVFSLGLSVAKADELMEVQALVDEARLTFARFVGHPEMTWLRENVKEAKGVFIAPNLVEAGYVITGSLGRGVLLVQDERTGQWSDPAFYSAVGAGVGLQIGAKRSEIVALVMTPKGVESMLSSTVVFGTGVDVAAGTIGGGLSGAMTPGLTADIIVFARSKGGFLSLSLAGTVLAVRDRWHAVYYGKSVEPTDILLARDATNWYSDRLRATLARTGARESQPASQAD